jgi:hypothetical protein
MAHSDLRETPFGTFWDGLGHFRPFDVPVLFPKSSSCAAESYRIIGSREAVCLHIKIHMAGGGNCPQQLERMYQWLREEVEVPVFRGHNLEGLPPWLR